MVTRNETETSVSSPVSSVHIQARSVLEDLDSDITYDGWGILSKKIISTYITKNYLQYLAFTTT